MPTTLSYSQLTSARACGERLRLTRLLREDNASERQAVYLIGGHAFHAATERFDKTYFSGPVENPFMLGTDCWWTEWAQALTEARDAEPDESKWIVAGKPTKAKPNAEDVAWWGDAGENWMDAYVEWRELGGWQPFEAPGGLAIEMDINATFGEALVRNILDRAEVTPAGELVIVDIKTGSKTPDDPTQLAQYAHAFGQVMDIDAPRWGSYYMARKGAPTPLIDLSSITKEFLDGEYTTLHRMRASGLFLANPGWGCGHCGVRDFCAAKGGKRANEYAGRIPDY